MEKIKNPIFILGSPRSGTTLLATLLKQSRYGEPIETHFITKYYKRLDTYGDLREKNKLAMLLKDIFNERAVMQWKIEVDLDDFYKGLEEYTYEYIVNRICMLRAQKKGHASWGDKTPHYTLDLDIIYKLFPDSKYIYIVRDGRDVALSLMNEPWGPSNVYSCAKQWEKYHVDHNYIIDKLKQNDQLLLVRYEDLLDNAQTILPEIYGFLNEDYDEKLMQPLIDGIKKGNYNKWKKIMSPSQVRLFENIAASTLKKYGYEATYDEQSSNMFYDIFYRLQDSFKRIKFLFKINVIDTMKIKFLGKEPFAE